MGNKYYTPKIEEFHVGFEFEDNRYGQPKTDDEIIDYENSWYKETLNCDLSGMDIYTIKQEIDEKNIRVKYLDKDDIEELGWDGKNNTNPYFYQVYHYKHSIDNLPGGYKVYECVLYHCSDLNRVKIEFKIEGEWEKMFEGTVKNKSKLREVMEMIGIKNE